VYGNARQNLPEYWSGIIEEGNNLETALGVCCTTPSYSKEEFPIEYKEQLYVIPGSNDSRPIRLTRAHTDP
jgi:hypothetical protein